MRNLVKGERNVLLPVIFSRTSSDVSRFDSWLRGNAIWIVEPGICHFELRERSREAAALVGPTREGHVEWFPRSTTYNLTTLPVPESRTRSDISRIL